MTPLTGKLYFTSLVRNSWECVTFNYCPREVLKYFVREWSGWNKFDFSSFQTHINILTTYEINVFKHKNWELNWFRTFDKSLCINFKLIIPIRSLGLKRNKYKIVWTVHRVPAVVLLNKVDNYRTEVNSESDCCNCFFFRQRNLFLSK